MKPKFAIRKKLNVIILPILAITFVLVILIAYNSSKKSIQTKTQALLEAEASASANSVESWMNHNLGILDTAVDTMVYQEMDREALLVYEARFLETYNDFPNGIYIVADDGQVVDASGWEPEEDPRTKSYYILGKECVGQMQFIEAYLDEFTNEFVVTAARYEPELLGGAVICVDISLGILSDTVSGVQIEGNGDAFIIDMENYMILAHKDQSLRGVETANIADAFYGSVARMVETGTTKYQSVPSKDGVYMVSYEPIEGTNWVVVGRALEKNMFADLTRLGIQLAVVGVVVVLILAVVITLTINRVTTPIRKMTDTIGLISEGDFTMDVPVTGNDEVTVMANNLNQFLEKMRATFRTFMDSSETIDGQAEGSEAIADELYGLASGQYEAMASMMDNLSELADSINAIAEDATTLAMVVADTDAAGENVLSNITATMKDADAGRTSMQAVTNSMDEAKESMDRLGHSVLDVGEAAKKIDEITSTIMEIASQTNLLALNASIEAARAGEAGKGFAVVATEIKSLADTSANAANEISNLISSVTRLIDETVNRSKLTVDQINDSALMVEEASKQFNQIYESIAATNQIVDTMIDKIHSTNDVASNMAAITEEQSASAEEIEATSENVKKLAQTVTDNSSQMKNDAEQLTVTANELKEKINQFRI